MNYCGAKTRAGTPCKSFALKNKSNGRCRLHGGLSTGAKTEAGKQRQIAANTKHGFYLHAAKNERLALKQLLKDVKELVKSIEGA